MQQQDKKKRNNVAVVGLALVVALAGMSTTFIAQVGGPAPEAPGSSARLTLSSNQWNTFVVDVTVHAAHVTADGTPVGVPSAPMQYRWERSQSGAGWKTVMTIADRPTAGADAGSRRTAAQSFTVARVEDDEDGSPLRMYGRSGERLKPPSMSQLQDWMETGLRQLGPDAANALRGLQRRDEAGAPSPSPLPAPRRFVGGSERDWVGGFVATPDERAARRSRLTQQFVRSGQVRGLDRFTRADGKRQHEVLADPQSAVPVEVNTLGDGGLQSHSTIAYTAEADGSLVRRAVHVEQVLSEAGDRAVTDTAYANVHVERRR